MEETLYDTPLCCECARLDAGMVRMPDEATIFWFRQLLEGRSLSTKLLAVINATLNTKGLMLKTCKVVDATVIAGPGATKNRAGERDPEMHQTKKGNQWHFGMKARIGSDAYSGQERGALDNALCAEQCLDGAKTIAWGYVSWAVMAERLARLGLHSEWKLWGSQRIGVRGEHWGRDGWR